ncbi:MAG: hypothetical protein ACE5I9_12925 [Candidatus Methylomirabilales bacterium]
MKRYRIVSLLFLLPWLLLPPPVSAVSVENRIEVLEQELRTLRRELEEQKKEAAKEKEEAKKREVAKAEEERPGGPQVTIGGYGSTRFEALNLDDSNNSFVFRRFVLTADASVTDRLRTYFELEFERFTQLELERKIAPSEGGLKVVQAVEGSNKSEISLEQAWLQYDIAPALKLRAGAVLVPLGRFNIRHDDNLWDLPRRSLVDRGVPVLPAKSAWPELGAGLLGEVPVGREGIFTYELYAVNGVGLDAEVEEVIQTRDPKRDKLEVEVEFRPTRGPFDQDLNENKAFAGRITYGPSIGNEVGLSGYVGGYAPEFLDGQTVWSTALDGKVTLGPFELEGEYVFTRWNGVKSVARDFAEVARDSAVEIKGVDSPDLEVEIEFELENLADYKHGYWIDLRYRFWPSFLDDTLLARSFDNPQLVATIRGEQVFFKDLIGEIKFTDRVLTMFETRDATLNRVTLGLGYRPTPLWVFQLAYEFTFTDEPSLVGLTNFLPASADEDEVHAFLAGIAFGF